MLHALLHRKLDPLRPDAHRLEDALTSTVFTTLLHAGAAAELVQWLADAEVIHGSSALLHPSFDGVWFWPRLAHAEPDVAIRLGYSLVIVEAKLRSGRHDRAKVDDSTAAKLESDQIRRQWQSLSDPHSARFPALQRAILECHPILVYVVDGQRIGRARREIAESIQTLPREASVWLLTWQRLYCQLFRTAAKPIWAQDLIAALDLFGVGGFAGFVDIELPTGELAHLRSVTLARPRPCRWEEGTLDSAHGIAVIRWTWNGSPGQAWNWSIPALRDTRPALAALTPFFLAWTASPDRHTDGGTST